MSAEDSRALIAHVVFQFDVGGLENGVVNLINRLPADRFRHAVIAMTNVSPSFCSRLERNDVEILALKKTPGPGYKLWPAFYRRFRRLRPSVVHTRNLAPLEAVPWAFLAGVPVRIHGEHGWDVDNVDGENAKHRRVRRAYRPWVTHYVALSRHIADYLSRDIGVVPERISQIYNGVDTVRFRRDPSGRSAVTGSPFSDARYSICGTVGRLAHVKDQVTLIRALALAHRRSAEARGLLRLAIVGGGPLQAALTELARAEGVREAVWISGERNDIPDVMRGLDVFALPSLAEGISNTILEAMSSCLPVIATRVGGNVELVDDGVSGTLVPPTDVEILAGAMLRYFDSPELALHHGRAGRKQVESSFSLQGMVDRYQQLYESSLGRAGVIRRRAILERFGKGAWG